MSESQRQISRWGHAAIFAAVIAAGSSMAGAHVSVNSPNGGETYLAGDSIELEWRIVISHNLQNWDLWYSTESNSGDWIEIAMDVAAGDSSAGSVHTYSWTAPDINDDTVWFRVRMDNSGTDYTDVSNAPFAIVPAPGAAAMFGLAGLAGIRRRR
jgi:hypothetical protein